MNWFKTLANWIPGSGLVQGITSAISAWQDRKAAKQADKADWELAALRRSSTALRFLSFATIWGPIYHAYYLAMTRAQMETPEDVAEAVRATFSAFPQWWTAAAVTILLAVWGHKETSAASAVAQRERKRAAESETRQDRPGPPEGGK